MDYDVVWSPEAIQDLDEIGEFLARNSVRYANSVVEKTLETARKLPLFPLAGRMVPELSEPAIREKFVHNYRLIYRVEAETIIVLAVIHFKRLLPLEIRETIEDD